MVDHFVITTSGAIGQLVGQIGIKLELLVLLVLTKKSLIYLEEIGLDAAFNHKTVDIQRALGERCPDGIEI